MRKLDSRKNSLGGAGFHPAGQRRRRGHEGEDGGMDAQLVQQHGHDRDRAARAGVERGLAINLGQNLACGVAGIVAFEHKEGVGADFKAVDLDAQAMRTMSLDMG